MIEAVRKFMEAGEQPNTPEQVAKQIGFALEELDEALCSLEFPVIETPIRTEAVKEFANQFKAGEYTDAVDAANKVELLDGLLDLAWVAIGGAIAMGADVEGAWSEIVRSNMSKANPETGRMDKDANGKVIKPAGYSKPDLARFLSKGE